MLRLSLTAVTLAKSTFDTRSPRVKAAKLPWSTCQALAAKHGGSFFIADVARFAQNCHRFQSAFRKLYPNTKIGYSYKTNYLPQFIRQAHSSGTYAEVVSRFELDLAIKLGVPGDQIIFNGPVKHRPDLLHAAEIGAKVNIDSLEELNLLLSISDELPQSTPVGLRCFLGENTPDSRFGIDLLCPDGSAALKTLDSNPKVYLAGLHCHHSGNRSLKRYEERLKALISIHRGLLDNRPLAYIDIGGGFASPMGPALASQMSGPVPTFEDYANAVGQPMVHTYGYDGPELILEPGMALLADSMVFITQIEALKVLAGREVAVVNGSIMNIKPLRGNANLPISIVPITESRHAFEGTWDVVGSTCMEIDILHNGYVGNLATGDFVVVENVGAYSTVLSAPFINGTPAILELNDKKPERVLKFTSTADDLLAMYETLS